MGRRWSAACVALEVTQRCNLDCSLCYLSENSEAVQDLPLAEVLRRAEQIHRYYGPGTDVQITGGDPTLRNREELISIVRKVSDLGMRPTLMTNGRRATRDLLAALADAGLVDVAFHVDTTQQIKGYADERALNVLRQKYIDAAAGLPISIMFNTTVHAGNLSELPMLADFFLQNADHIRTASFQLQADTGRGVLGKRDALVTPDSVMQGIQAGADIAINFNSVQVGHPQCSRYGMCHRVNGKTFDLFDDADAIGRFQVATAGIEFNRQSPIKVIRGLAAWLLAHPGDILFSARWAYRKLRQIGLDFIKAKGRMHTLSFVVHNFMDACQLQPERIDACVFKTMTRDGPISMCMHNAKRDEFIGQRVVVSTDEGVKVWYPFKGKYYPADGMPAVEPEPEPPKLTLKQARGRLRDRLLAERFHGI